ncbi:MAG: DUF4260 domain-containing protein [Sulfitobacter sp.]
MQTSTFTQSSPIQPVRMILQAEGALLGLVCTMIYAQTGAGWLLFALLLLGPDLAMLGYLAGDRIGALCYNIGHTYLTPAALAALGYATGVDGSLPIALIWGAHIGFDRAIGYGLKYASGFKVTHLARV